MTVPMSTFECQLYVPAHGSLAYRLPAEPGPRPIAKLQPLGYDELVDPSFRRLLVAFNRLTAVSAWQGQGSEAQPISLRP